MVDAQGYGDWRSVEMAIKDAAKKTARAAGAGVSAATVDAQIRQARYDRFLSRVFAEGEDSEWMLKGGMSMLARVPRSRTTKDVDLAARGAADLAEAERQLSALVAVDLGDHLTFRLPPQQRWSPDSSSPRSAARTVPQLGTPAAFLEPNGERTQGAPRALISSVRAGSRGSARKGAEWSLTCGYGPAAREDVSHEAAPGHLGRVSRGGHRLQLGVTA